MSPTAVGEGRILVAAALRQEISPRFNSLPAGADLLFTGVGKGRAGAAVSRALGQGGYTLVVSAGFAGGASAGLRAGELVAATEVIDLASQKRFIPSGKAPASFPGGRWITVDQAVVEPKAKEELGRRFQAKALEMESSAVAQAADEAGVAWAGLRSILDPMEERLAVPSAAWALQRMLRPSFWAELSRFLATLRRAREGLTAGIVQLLN